MGPEEAEPAGDLLEREVDLAALASALSESRGGTGRLVLVRGEAGIGKTSLLRAFAATVRPAGSVAWGVSDPLEAPRPLGPVIEAASGLGLDLGSDDRDSASQRLVETLRRHGRGVLFIEDLHWADQASIEVIGHLARRIHRLPALVVVTLRDDELPPTHPLGLALADLSTAPGVRTLRPARLSREAVSAMLGDAAAGAEAWRLTDGNPFFVAELRDALPARLPRSVRDSVQARLARLSSSGRAAAEVVAVAGPRCESWLLAGALSAEADAVEECLHSGLLVASGDSLGYRHELARQAALDVISPPRRVFLHRALLDLLAARPSTRTDLARLVEHAVGAGDEEAILRLAPAAGREANARSAHRQAEVQYRRALEVGGDLPRAERAGLLEAYASEAHLTEHRQEAVAAWREAVRLRALDGESAAVVDDLVRLVSVLFRAGRTQEADAAVDEAVALAGTLPPGPSVVRAYRSRAYLRMLTRDSADAVRWARRALAVAGEIGEEDLSEVYNALGSALIVGGRPDEGETELLRAVEVARHRAEPLPEALAYSNLGSALGEMGLASRARPYLRAAVEAGERHDLQGTVIYASAWLALAELACGDWTAARSLAEGVLVRPVSPPIALVMARICLGRLAARRGEPAARGHLDEALLLAEATQTFQRRAPALAARAEAAWLSGDLDRCRAEATAALDEAVARGHGPLSAELACWARFGGDDRAVPEVASGPWALLASGDWRAAADAWRSHGGVFERALALSTGDEAAQREALEVLDGLGASALARRVRRALRDAGVRNIPRAPGSPRGRAAFGLSPRESEVLALLVEGLPNAAIADRLTLSARTVDHHVSAILGKTGAASRGEAVALALRAGWVGGGGDAKLGDIAHVPAPGRS